MPTLIAWFAVVGSWFVVIGTLDQAIRELSQEADAVQSVRRAAQHAPREPVSGWWALMPPVYLLLRQRQGRRYRNEVRARMSTREMDAFDRTRRVATAWAYIATGASLVATKATWDLTDENDWGPLVFTTILATTVALVAIRAAHIARERDTNRE